mmetsp:Transcript_12891/g.25204  ORF Transcript_12891/g.25204 Transcript_12891/m.25204 type:complete len:222 (-) Transcript_12891:197-862(-)
MIAPPAHLAAFVRDDKQKKQSIYRHPSCRRSPEPRTKKWGGGLGHTASLCLPPPTDACRYIFFVFFCLFCCLFGMNLSALDQVLAGVRDLLVDTCHALLGEVGVRSESVVVPVDGVDYGVEVTEGWGTGHLAVAPLSDPAVSGSLKGEDSILLSIVVGWNCQGRLQFLEELAGFLLVHLALPGPEEPRLGGEGSGDSGGGEASEGGAAAGEALLARLRRYA